MQVAVLEIILGKTPTIFTTANVDTAVSVLGSASLENNQVNATGLMGELVKKGTYVGINDQALSQIKNYIVENVIGNQKFYETDQDNNFERQDYETVIDTIWQDRDSFMFKSIFDQITMEGCVFDEYPATYIKDYKSNSFFINSNDDIAFEHIESAEYQSILVMPSETQYLEEIWLFLVSDRQFKVNFYTRYYNHETNTLYVSDVKSVYTTVESEFKAESTPIAEATFYNDIIKISEFDNNLGNDILKADNIVPMNLERSQYYSPQESLNNFGTISVFNPEAFAENDFSFAEIVFDVEKNSNLDQDYNFKIGMFYYGVPSSEAIREFERK